MHWPRRYRGCPAAQSDRQAGGAGGESGHKKVPAGAPGGGVPGAGYVGRSIPVWGRPNRSYPAAEAMLRRVFRMLRRRA